MCSQQEARVKLWEWRWHQHCCMHLRSDTKATWWLKWKSCWKKYKKHNICLDSIVVLLWQTNFKHSLTRTLCSRRLTVMFDILRKSSRKLLSLIWSLGKPTLHPLSLHPFSSICSAQACFASASTSHLLLFSISRSNCQATTTRHSTTRGSQHNACILGPQIDGGILMACGLVLVSTY